MRRYKKLIVAGVVAAAVAGGTGAAMAADGGHGGHGKAPQTVSHGAAHWPGAGSKEKGLTRVTKDDGKPGWSQNGTAPSDGSTPDTYSHQGR